MKSCLEQFCEINMMQSQQCDFVDIWNLFPSVWHLSWSSRQVGSIWAILRHICFNKDFFKVTMDKLRAELWKQVKWTGLVFTRTTFFSKKFAVHFHFPFNSVLPPQRRLCLLAKSCLSAWPGIPEVCKNVVMIVFIIQSQSLLCQNSKSFQHQQTTSVYRFSFNGWVMENKTHLCLTFFCWSTDLLLAAFTSFHSFLEEFKQRSFFIWLGGGCSFWQMDGVCSLFKPVVFNWWVMAQRNGWQVCSDTQSLLSSKKTLGQWQSMSMLTKK